MDRCPKCDGVMLSMKVKQTILPDAEKKQGLKCSRCGFYEERKQIFLGGQTDEGHQPLNQRYSRH